MAERMLDPQNTQIKLQQEPRSVKSSIFETILRKVTDGILWIDLEGTVKIASLSLEKMVPDVNGPLAGRRFWDLFADDFFGFSMRESLRYGISHDLVYKNNLEISTVFLYQGEKQDHGLLIKVSDIAEREQFRSKLVHNEQIQELGSMAARLAHEIRNPLGGIRGFAMLLERDLASHPHLQELVGQILDGTRALEKLTSSMLEFVKTPELSIETRDITAFLRNMARFVKVDPAFPSNISLVAHIPDKPLLVPFDADALTRALLNLLTNGIQALEDGGELTLSLLHNGTHCQITVADNGVGMEDVGTLFTPFFTTKPKGNGLGLVETKKIISLHGGTIDVHSHVKKGSSFIITLPMRRQ